jgi:hypothetical protein
LESKGNTHIEKILKFNQLIISKHMKKIFVLPFLIFFTSIAFAQRTTYKLFKVDTHGGYAIPSSADAYKGGVCLSIEPKFNITDNIAIGLKSEGAILASFDSYEDDYSTLSVVSSTLLTAEYYLGQKLVRPFFGGAAGLFRTIIIDSEDELEFIKGGRTFGFSPRAGLQISHFRLVAEYNLVKNANYLSIKLGTTFGGGKMK